MRKAITALLLGVTAATPVLAQPDGPDELRRDRQEIRRDRTEVRQQRQEYRQTLNQGDYREADRDRAELRRDRGELRDSRRELQSDRRGDQPGFADRRDFRQDRRDDFRDRRDDRQDFRGDNRQDFRRDNRQDFRRDNRQDFRRDNRFAGNGGGWNNGWRNDNRYDWQRYRSTNRRSYTLPRYYGPQGFGNYRQWGVGHRLGAPFYAQNYWLNDPFAYRLPPAYGNYRWVRYYNDVLLVDIYTGVVRDAIYGFFY